MFGQTPDVRPDADFAEQHRRSTETGWTTVANFQPEDTAFTDGEIEPDSSAIAKLLQPVKLS